VQRLFWCALVTSSSWAGMAFAEEPPPLAGPAAEPVAPAPGTFDADAISKSATRKYQQGEYSAAVGELLDALEKCDSLSRTECPDQKKAMFYRDLGVVYAGGLDKHHDGVKSFQEALRLDSAVDVPPILDTPPVRAAYDEAKGGQPAVPATGDTRATGDTAPAGEIKESEPHPHIEAGDLLLRVDGRMRVAAVVNNGATSRGAGQFGAELGVLVHPAAMPIVVGAAAEVSENVIPATGNSAANAAFDFGTWSFAGLVGGAFKGRRNVGYFAGGFGAQGLPVTGQVAPVVCALGGASFGGFDFGGGFDVGFYSGFEFVSFGIHLGWGRYLK
jgi:hypothetical protein